MTTIRAAVCRAFSEPLAIEEVTLAAPRAGEVRVRMEACAICHSDISYARGDWGGALPAVYGHEGVGRIVATGPGVGHVGPGDRVLVTLIRSCGTCAACATAAPCYCTAPAPDSPLSGADGAPIAHGLATAGFAEEVIVHASQLAPVPEDMPAEAACLLACGVVTGVGSAVNVARVRSGESVVVIGAGGVGLNAVQGARIAGAGRIVAVDMTEDKLATARAFGATDGLLAGGEKPWRTLRGMLPHGADVVLVTVGAIPAVETGLRFLAPRGRMILVGMPATGAVATLEPVILASLGQGMQGSKMGDTVLARDIPWLVELWRQGRLHLEPLVSATWPLARINEAVADTLGGAARRNVILFDA